MATMDDGLRYRLQRSRRQRFHAIVRTESDATPIAQECALRGMEVHRTFRLVPGVALTATGDDLLALADDPHVTHIELDQDVMALD